jgi:hypothetical protein
MTITVTADGVHLYVREIEDQPEATPHRRIVVPGHYVGNVWTLTDMAAEPAEVVEAATAAWTAQAVEEYRLRQEAKLPTPEQLAAHQAVEAAAAAKLEIKADAFVNSFIAMTPAEVTAYINTNVTSLVTAKTVINKLALMVLLLARREFKD